MLQDDTIKASKKVSVQGRVVDAVRKAVFSGALQPGDPVLEMRLARQCNVSQTTVREALAKLEHTGFIRRIPNKGSFVTKLSPEEFRERLELRVLLEGLAAMKAARYMTRQDVDELERRLKDVSRAASKNAYYELVVADLQFHRYIWECSHNKTLYLVLDQLAAPFIAVAGLRRGSPRHSVSTHKPIVCALKDGKAKPAMEAMRRHIETSYAEFLNSGLDGFDVMARLMR